jgi:hypothetical protein
MVILICFQTVSFLLVHHILDQACSGCSSWATHCSCHSIKLLMQTFEVRKGLLFVYVTKQGWKAKAILQTYRVFICGDVHYNTA